MVKEEKLKPSFCLKADIIGSRLSQKSEMLPGVVKDLNKEFGQSLIAGFSIRAGDELFAVFNNIRDGYLGFKALYQETIKLDIPVYVGLGVGEVYEQNLFDPERINGSAIWSASNALDELKQKRNTEIQKRVQKKKFQYNIHVGNDNELNLAVESYLFFIMSRINKLTKDQSEAIRARETYPDWGNDKLYWFITKTDERTIPKNNAIANFSKLLQRAGYQLTLESETAYIHLLEFLFERRG